MRKITMMVSMVLAAVMLLSMIACSGKLSWGDRLEKYCEENKDASYSRKSRSSLKDLADELEDEMDERLDGDIIMYYSVYDDDDGCVIVEFEEKDDAEMVAEFIEDEDMADKAEQIGNVVIFGDKGLVNAMVKLD